MRKGTAKSKTRNHLINYSELARRLGVSPSCVRALFRGERMDAERMEEAVDLIVEELCITDRHLRRSKVRLARSIRRKMAMTAGNKVHPW